MLSETLRNSLGVWPWVLQRGGLSLTKEVAVPPADHLP